MAKAGTTVYTKTREELEEEFEFNKKLNENTSHDPGAERRRLPENMTEYYEQMIIENIRSLKLLEKENIPAELKSYRLQYLEKQQNILLDSLAELE